VDSKIGISAMSLAPKCQLLKCFGYNFMSGLAEKIFAFREEGDFADIDLFFAKKWGETEEEICFLASLMAFSRNGHLCLKIEEKVKPTIENKGLEEHVIKGAREIPGIVVRDGARYYLQRNWILESRVIATLQKLWERDVKPLDIPPFSGLSAKQQEAVKKGLKESFLLLSGGPGSGKTHTITALVKSYLETGKREVIIAAPTGKAAAHLKECLRKEMGFIQVGTIHALLKMKKASDLVWKRRRLQGGMLIVDECSMIDVALWGALLKAIPEGMRVILVGDHEQLPPVETGTVFGELCQFAKVHKEQNYVHLDECMRTEQQGILELARCVKEGEGVLDALTKVVHKGLEEDWEEWYSHFPKPERGEPDVEKLFREMKEFRILSCLRDGPWGVKAINEKLKKEFAENWAEGEVWPIPIIVTRTSYRLELYNGEMGILLKRDFCSHLGENDTAVFMGANGEFRKIAASLLSSFEYGYCLSIHKSQGSEFEKVVFIVPKGAEVFGREILYTGITRSRSYLEIRGEKGVIEDCSLRSSRKLSGIVERL
jgi:exodeoxyribonuclease V alpha subunit